MLGPWQVAQPELMPAWLNCALAKVVMPVEGTRPVGAPPRWQVSQDALVGTWAGANALMPTGNTPVKVPAVTVEPWQVAQLTVAPLWLNSELAKLAPSVTGVVAMLELVPTWQDSQLRLPMEIWLASGALMMLLAVRYRAALATLWHCTQLPLVFWMLA